MLKSQDEGQRIFPVAPTGMLFVMVHLTVLGDCMGKDEKAGPLLTLKVRVDSENAYRIPGEFKYFCSLCHKAVFHSQSEKIKTHEDQVNYLGLCI